MLTRLKLDNIICARGFYAPAIYGQMKSRLRERMEKQASLEVLSTIINSIFLVIDEKTRAIRSDWPILYFTKQELDIFYAYYTK